jgi:hypothetical protein
MKQQRTDARSPVGTDSPQSPGALAEIPTPRPRRRRLATAMVIVLAVIVGAGMSVIPVPDRISTREVRRPGAVGKPKQPMEVVEKGYGIPFRTYVRAEGPRGATPVTYAHLEVRLSGVILNILIAALLGVIALGSLRRRVRQEVRTDAAS